MSVVRRTVPLALCALLLVPGTAQAGVFDIFGFGARNVAMGGAATATSDDYTAAFYNPAGLTRRKLVHVGLGFASYFQALAISHRNPGDEGLEARAPGDAMGIDLGVVFPLGGKIEDRIALGIALYVPVAQALRLEALDPAAPRWYRYQTLADKLHIAAAVGAELADWVRIGVGIQALAELEGGVDVGIDLTNKRFSRRDAVVQLVTTAAPVVGVLFTPLDGWHIGLSYRGAIAFEYAIPLRFDFGQAVDLEVLVSGTDLYTPHTIGFGTAYTIDAARLTLSLDAELALWSLAPDPSLRVEVLANGDLIEELGLEDYFDLRPGNVAQAGFRDTLTLRLGAELQPLDWLVLRAGYFWRQTATGAQIGSTTYLDSDAHVASLGAAVTFPDPLAVDDLPVTFDITGQITVHPDAQVSKADHGNPIGTVDYGGQIYGLVLSLRHDL